jgi:hypothetical protein
MRLASFLLRSADGSPKALTPSTEAGKGAARRVDLTGLRFLRDEGLRASNLGEPYRGRPPSGCWWSKAIQARRSCAFFKRIYERRGMLKLHSTSAVDDGQPECCASGRLQNVKAGPRHEMGGETMRDDLKAPCDSILQRVTTGKDRVPGVVANDHGSFLQHL